MYSLECFTVYVKHTPSNIYYWDSCHMQLVINKSYMIQAKSIRRARITWLTKRKSMVWDLFLIISTWKKISNHRYACMIWVAIRIEFASKQSLCEHYSGGLRQTTVLQCLNTANFPACLFLASWFTLSLL